MAYESMNPAVRSSDGSLAVRLHDIRSLCTPCTRRVVFVTMVVAVILCLGLGITFGASGMARGSTTRDPKDAEYIKIMNEIDPENIKNNLRYLTEYPHHPGSVRNTQLAEKLAQLWRDQGFDKTEVFRYNILMSYPEQPGEIWLREKENVVKKLVIENEPPIDDTERKGEPLFPFNAFSPSGNITARYVYGGFGRASDFETLQNLGVDVKGKIMILRYGKGSRSGKVQVAESLGAAGVILYTDPYDYTYPGMEYPKGWMLNRDGVQRGTINRLTGDALSPGYPSKPKYFRTPMSKYSGNPTIPSQPVSYGTAYEILSRMRGKSIPLPTGFQGGFNFTYALTSDQDQTLTLKVSTKMETRESLSVCTSLYGHTEPDRYVMIGNHRDSWTYGGADPSSGTATMMEIVRVLGRARKSRGWRPRRSVMACSWGAEESGIQGSTEWTDENHQFIMQKVVGYANVDMAVEGNFTVRLKSLEFVGSGIYKAAALIHAPDNAKKTLYEDWHEKSKILRNDDSLTQPFLITPASGSDYRSFWHKYGTTIADLRYLFSAKDYPRLGANGHYHTRYESFGWMSKYVDPDFRYHVTVGKLWSGYTLQVADSALIPYDLVAYTTQVKFYLKQFENNYGSLLDQRNISLSFMRNRLEALHRKCVSFKAFMSGLDLATVSPYRLRSINDKLMNFERNFIVIGISKRASTRHVVYASAASKLKRGKFPGISEAIFVASKPNGGGGDWDDVRKQITLVVWCFDTANRSLDFDELKG